MAERRKFRRGKSGVTFVDLFAGAGGISEGFLQAFTSEKYYDFVLASDINENCELTHKVRYNTQLGLDTKFITEDIMSPEFLSKLLEALGGRQVDVVTGGPSCQSFSLSGRRRRFDKRDGLFNHYLKVIKALRPKYFVMENVKGLLTKDNGNFKKEIMREMRSIIDERGVGGFLIFASSVLRKSKSKFFAEAFLQKLQMEITSDDSKAFEFKEKFFDLLGEQLKAVTRKIDYKTSKSDSRIATIRHGISLLRRSEERAKIKAAVINEKTFADIDNDAFAEKFNSFLQAIADEDIAENITAALAEVEELKNAGSEIEDLKLAVQAYTLSLDECFDFLGELAGTLGKAADFDCVMQRVRLYNVEQMILLASDYGVPQNRERVVFIGSRNDQEKVKEIPASVRKEEWVTVYEAISDLDFIGNGETRTKYAKPEAHHEFEPLVRKRKVDGEVFEDGKTFAEWSREGRLSHRFDFECAPFYVKDFGELQGNALLDTAELFNHQTSLQNETVMRRLKVIAECGGYTSECKERLKAEGLESNKRNYFVLRAEKQSPTVVTMPDDFIHYSRYRAMTVREMARLQSFDDSFVFQGKRQTGGNKRKSEIPQYTLVGNAVPPLMARAIGMEILKKIK